MSFLILSTATNPGFDEKYVALMASGFPDTPIRLLQKHLKLNPFEPETVSEAMKVFEQKLNELDSLYQQ